MVERHPAKTAPHRAVPRLGAVLRDARKAAGLSAQAVAEASGLSIDTVRSIESGRTASPAFVTVARLAAVLDVSLDSLSGATLVDGRSS
ncbi:helix-turn-helix transcriptional regulator [Gordonia sp. X0973]|uniref:helix-turn-helix domain-containing protein n=1 Tax=Gordonia sp. X0973 TaxID=2742602 RepID=UPI000F524C9B|nr:helix-turn-helix domain-containing protein [Gordonia sp. X0973]QKT08003.1 helix-turn-helix transcriptional regulator [Gordonia sp. X0973]